MVRLARMVRFCCPRVGLLALSTGGPGWGVGEGRVGGPKFIEITEFRMFFFKFRIFCIVFGIALNCAELCAIPYYRIVVKIPRLVV
jgi:hypothetical protein